MSDTSFIPSSPAPGAAATLEAFAEAAALVRPGGRILLVNSAFIDLFGPGPWQGRSLDALVDGPHDRDAAPWRRATGASISAAVKTAAGEAPPMRVTARPAMAGVLVATLVLETHAPAVRALAETRLDLASRSAALSQWRYDFDTAEGWLEGPLAGPAGAGFGPAAWRGRVHPDDLGSLTAAFLAMEFGARFEQRYRMLGADGRWCVHHAVGAREPGFGQDARRASGFVREAGTGEAEFDADPVEAAASARMSAWTYDLRTRRLRLSGPILKRLALPGSAHEIDILDWRARAPSCDLPEMDRATEELRARGVTEVEYRIAAETGELVWLSLRGGVSEQDASGAVLRYSGFISEISARRQLELKLADRERQLSEAVDAGLIGIWSIDLATGLQTVQGRLASWMEAGDDNAVGAAHWRALIHPDELPAAHDAFQAVREGRNFPTFDYRLRAPEGWRWARTTGQVVERDPAGRPLRAAGVVIDVSAERALALALGKEKRRFETVYQNTPALMHSVSADGRTLMVSDYWVARMGYAREEAIGKPGWRFFAPEDRDRVRDDVIPRSLREGVISNVPLTALTASGERLEVRLSAFWERDEAGRPLRAHGVFAEVGDLNEVRRTLEARNDELARVNRELGRFTTIASHDLQEPLRKMSAFASLLRRRYAGALDADADQSLEYLVDAAGRLRALIDDLLAYSRASSRTLEPETVRLCDIWRETVEGQDLQIAEAEAAVETGDLPAVLGDRVLL
ncbi:MAG: PAS domain-containing protein, partial [Oceanicaulis sp.]